MIKDFKIFPYTKYKHVFPWKYRIKQFFLKIWHWFFPRRTSIKPTGVTSLAIGSASGIEPVVSEKYFRMVSYSLVKDPVYPYAVIDPKILEEWKNEKKTKS